MHVKKCSIFFQCSSFDFFYFFGILKKINKVKKKMKILFLGYRNGNCGRGPVFMWIFILFPDRFFCFVADWPPRLLFFIFWFQNAQKLWSNSLSSSSVPQRKHDSVSKSVSFHQNQQFLPRKWPFFIILWLFSSKLVIACPNIVISWSKKSFFATKW